MGFPINMGIERQYMLRINNVIPHLKSNNHLCLLRVYYSEDGLVYFILISCMLCLVEFNTVKMD